MPMRTRPPIAPGTVISGTSSQVQAALLPRQLCRLSRVDSAEHDPEARSESSEILVKVPKHGVGSQQH